MNKLLLIIGVASLVALLVGASSIDILSVKP